MRTPAQLRRDLAEQLDDLTTNVLRAPDLSAEETRMYRRFARAVRLRLFWLRPEAIARRLAETRCEVCDGTGFIVDDPDLSPCIACTEPDDADVSLGAELRRVDWIEARCEGCRRTSGHAPHRCPGGEELAGDASLCNCCESCTRRCADDV